MFLGKFLKFIFLFFFISIPVKFPEKNLFERPKVLKRIKNRKLKKRGTILLTERETFLIRENPLFENNLLRGIKLN
ncbi:MAG: hypothetical protein ABIN17_05050 [candidate division WOR-3 bacterium]